MKLIRSFKFLTPLVLCCAVGASAQTVKPEPQQLSAADEQKAVALLEQTVTEAASLKLPENRVSALAAAADLLWRRDEKRARALSKNAAAEIVAAFADDAGEIDEFELPERFYRMQSVRHQFLNRIAQRDAEFALDLQRQTRPSVIERMMLLPANEIPLYRNLYQFAQIEANLEKELAAHLLQQNPRRALEIARANLSKGVSHNDLALIAELKKTDARLAEQFADEAAQQLLKIDLASVHNHNERSVALAFLKQFTKSPDANQSESLNVNQTVLRQIAAKYADYLFASVQTYDFYEIENALPVFERILPERVAALRQKAGKKRQNQVAADPQSQFAEKFNKLQSDAVAPAAMIAEADNFPLEMRQQIYQTAANKSVQNNDYVAARQMLARVPGKQARANALRLLDQQIFDNHLNAGEYAKAEQIARQQSDNLYKISFLMNLARALFNKQQPEKARQYIAEARSIIKPTPENAREMSETIQVLSAAADIAPAETFEILESFIPKLNEIFAATAFLSKYQFERGNFRESEFVISQGGVGLPFNSRRTNNFFVGLEALRLDVLAKNDLPRAAALIDAFERPDVRIAARLIVLRSVLFDEKAANNRSSIYSLPVF